MQAALAPKWLMKQVQCGFPKFENLIPYVEGRRDPWQLAAFAVREVTGAFSWADVERIRQIWPRALIVKGLLHPEDAQRAVSAGADAIWVSNHGGRNFDPAPAALDARLARLADWVRSPDYREALSDWLDPP